MADRSETLNGWVWADGAGDPPAVPVTGVTYATSSITQVDIEKGWPFSSVVNSADFNEFLRRTTSILKDLEIYGVLPWCPTITYPVGAFVMGSNGYLYKAILPSLNEQPITDDGTYWTEYVKRVANISEDVLASDKIITSKSYTTSGLQVNFVPISPTNRRRISIDLDVSMTDEVQNNIASSYQLQYYDSSLGWVELRTRTLGVYILEDIVTMKGNIFFQFLHDEEDSSPQYRLVYKIDTSNVSETSTILVGSSLIVEELSN